MYSPVKIQDPVEAESRWLRSLEERAARLRRVLEETRQALARGDWTERSFANAVRLRELHDNLLSPMYELEDALVDARTTFYNSNPPVYQVMHRLLVNDETGFERFRSAEDMRDQMSILLNGARIMVERIQDRLWPTEVLDDPNTFLDTLAYVRIAYSYYPIVERAYEMFANRGWGNWPSTSVANRAAAQSALPVCNVVAWSSSGQRWAPDFQQPHHVRGLDILTMEQSDWHRNMITRIIDVMREIQSFLARIQRILRRYSQPPRYGTVLSDDEVQTRREVATVLATNLQQVYNLYQVLIESYGRRMFERLIMRLQYHVDQRNVNEDDSAIGLWQRMDQLNRSIGVQIRSAAEAIEWQWYRDRLVRAFNELTDSQEFLRRLSESSVGASMNQWFAAHRDNNRTLFPAGQTYTQLMLSVDNLLNRMRPLLLLITAHVGQYAMHGDVFGPDGSGSGGPGRSGSGAPGGSGSGAPGGSDIGGPGESGAGRPRSGTDYGDPDSV